MTPLAAELDAVLEDQLRRQTAAAPASQHHAAWAQAPRTVPARRTAQQPRWAGRPIPGPRPPMPFALM